MLKENAHQEYDEYNKDNFGHGRDHTRISEQAGKIGRLTAERLDDCRGLGDC